MSVSLCAKLVLVVSCVFSLPAAWKEVSKGFRFEKLLVVKGKRAVLAPRELLRQEFHYLGQGTQSYVFESGDGKYVLKLFRFEQATNPIYCFVRMRLRGKPLRLSRQAQVERLFSACRIADQLAREETALLFLHLEESEVGTVRLHLPFRGTVELCLDRCCFVLQEKGERIFPSLLASNLEERGRKLDSFQTLLQKRAVKGITNLDSDLHRNFGFIGERAIEIDFGAYEMVSREEAEKNQLHFTKKLQAWLDENRVE